MTDKRFAIDKEYYYIIVYLRFIYSENLNTLIKFYIISLTSFDESKLDKRYYTSIEYYSSLISTFVSTHSLSVVDLHPLVFGRLRSLLRSTFICLLYTNFLFFIFIHLLQVLLQLINQIEAIKSCTKSSATFVWFY